MAGLALGDIVAALGGELIGDPARVIERVGPLDATATPGTLSFLSNPRYAAELAGSQAGCVIVAPASRDAAVARGDTIVADQPYLYFARLTQLWARHARPTPVAGVHPSAWVDPTATVDAGASLGPMVVVEAGAQIGPGAIIEAHGYVGREAQIGEGTRLMPRVSFGDGCRIGRRGLLHSGVVIGADGFGFAPDGGRWEKIEQLGAVRIGDDVEIGANTCIDRGALDDTVIEDGVKLDDLIMIAHNVRIGAHTAMAACCGVAGSAVIGRHCMIGGSAMIAGHIEIVDHVVLSALTFVSRSIRKPGTYSGAWPFDDNATWEKNAATLRQLYTLRERVRALEKKTP